MGCNVLNFTPPGAPQHGLGALLAWRDRGARGASRGRNLLGGRCCLVISWTIVLPLILNEHFPIRCCFWTCCFSYTVWTSIFNFRPVLFPLCDVELGTSRRCFKSHPGRGAGEGGREGRKKIRTCCCCCCCCCCFFIVYRLLYLTYIYLSNPLLFSISKLLLLHVLSEFGASHVLRGFPNGRCFTGGLWPRLCTVRPSGEIEISRWGVVSAWAKTESLVPFFQKNDEDMGWRGIYDLTHNLDIKPTVGKTWSWQPKTIDPRRLCMRQSAKRRTIVDEKGNFGDLISPQSKSLGP